jgi:hypothetical protein
MLYTRFVIGEETLSSTSVFNFCHCAIFSRLIKSFILGPDIGHYRYVWSAAELQAENQDDGLVCTNVFGLWWSSRLLAMMDSARSLPH